MSKMTNRERRRLQQNESYSIGLGCTGCADRGFCGGINIPGLFSCLNLCCEAPESCDFVCPEDLPEFIRQINELGDLDLNSVPRAVPVDIPRLPLYAPIIYHGSANRRRLLTAEAVAISLMQLIDFRTGRCKFASYEEVCQKFGIALGAKIIVTGVADDLPLEKYWIARTPAFMKELTILGLSIVTTPNFSTYLNAPRWTDLSNIKRTLICWEELVKVGMPTSLHLNGRTSFDWQRLTEWVAERDEVQSVAFEFATVEETRKELCAERLVLLASAVPRRLQLVVRGGIDYLPRLSGYFDIVYLDADPFIMACRRSKATPFSKPVSVASSNLRFIDSLLEHNIRTRTKIVHDRHRPLGLEP